MKKGFLRYTAAFIIGMVIANAISVTAFASQPEYIDYQRENSEIKKAASSVEVALDSFSTDSALAEIKDGVLVWNSGNGKITFKAEIPETSLYNLTVVWRPCNTGTDLNMGIMIDGEYPFEAFKETVLPREWKNITNEPRCDSQGNEYAPEQVETGEFITEVLRDNTGVTVEPYEIALTEGVHSITLVSAEQTIEIKEILFSAVEQPLDYKEVSENYDIKNLSAEIITIQGEAADIKSDNSLIPKANNSDAGMTPNDAKISKINYIGSTAWNEPGEKLTWKFSVEKAGYYYINLRYKQSELVNGESWRWLKIDGKTPFIQAKALRFPYASGWKYYTFGKDEKPYYIYLDKGEHALSLEVTIGDQSEYFERLSQIVDVLGDEYIKIIMITGESPDINRDYELFKQIPDFTETLQDCKDNLDSLSHDMKKALDTRSTQSIAAMENMSRVIASMLKSPYIAQQYVTDYYTNYTSLSSWLFDMTSMPLSLDEIQIVPAGKEYENKNAGFFKDLRFGFVRLCSSFVQDYNVSSDSSAKDDKTITLWVNWGQDQAAVLNSLIEDSFTPEKNINVELKIVSASLINGILAGNFPDLSLHMSRTEPVNLGIRGALYDLSQFSDCEEVLKRFQPGADIPYRYNDALYALPDTQSFFMMFYRTDIFEKLNLTVPETWDEFLKTTVTIQRNNMNVYVPYTQIASSTTVNAGIGSLNLLPTLMSQNNLSFYNEEKNANALTDKAAINVFKQWTDFYTEYGVLKEADFYNRLRVGVMPLGIAPYSTYMTLYSAAPEIKGRWAIAPIPASQNGNRTIAGAGTGCTIIAKSSRKEQAWEFLKWWTSAEIQARYTNNVESLLGMIGRTGTANVEALNSLAWDSGDLEIINDQWEQVREVPEVPGSYYLVRCIDQAFWSVVNGDTNVKDAVVKWGEIADDEILRKIKEYS